MANSNLVVSADVSSIRVPALGHQRRALYKIQLGAGGEAQAPVSLAIHRSGQTEPGFGIKDECRTAVHV